MQQTVVFTDPNEFANFIRTKRGINVVIENLDEEEVFLMEIDGYQVTYNTKFVSPYDVGFITNPWSSKGGLNFLADKIHTNAMNKGFWDDDRNFGEAVALIHSELSEMLEAHRTGEVESEHGIPVHPVVEEAADAIIRLLDLAGAYGWDLDKAIIEKMQYNERRVRLHGKKY
jgi:hypothetical protein